MELSEVFEQAKIALEVNGWGQGAWLDRSTGCVCAEGAIIAAISGEPLPSPGALSDDGAETFFEAETFLSRFIEDETDGTERSLVGFNDWTAKSADDVVSLFDRAIEKVKSGDYEG